MDSFINSESPSNTDCSPPQPPVCLSPHTHMTDSTRCSCPVTEAEARATCCLFKTGPQRHAQRSDTTPRQVHQRNQNPHNTQDEVHETHVQVGSHVGGGGGGAGGGGGGAFRSVSVRRLRRHGQEREGEWGRGGGGGQRGRERAVFDDG